MNAVAAAPPTDREFLVQLQTALAQQLAGTWKPIARHYPTWPYPDPWSDPNEDALGRVRLAIVDGPGGLIDQYGEAIKFEQPATSGAYTVIVPIPRWFYIPEAVALVKDPVVRGWAQVNSGSAAMQQNRAYKFKPDGSHEYQLSDTLASNAPLLETFGPQLDARAYRCSLGGESHFWWLLYNEVEMAEGAKATAGEQG